MSSVRDFKNLVDRLKREDATGKDIALFKEIVLKLKGNLRGVFQVGKPLSPEKRIKKACLLIKLAEFALTLRAYEPVATVLAEIFWELEAAIEYAEEGLERFLAARNLDHPRKTKRP